MLEIGIMIEGQNGLTWPRWKKIAHLVEEAGFVGLFRSDHFTNARPPDRDSLELWTSLTWLADNTRRIEFGPLVSPVSFRHPALTARIAAAVDDLSGGRLTLGLGAGWQEREHQLFGFDLLDPKSRFDRFEEGLEVISRLLQQDEPVTFDGQFFQLREAQLLPRPQQPRRPRILVGGNGKNRTLSIVARYADEWNCIALQPDEFRALNTSLDRKLLSAGRSPDSVRRSMMAGCIFGKDDTALNEKLRARKYSLKQAHERGLVAGSAEQINQQLKALAEAGLQRIMLQWLELDDLEGLEALAKAVM